MKGLRFWTGCVLLAGVLAACGGEKPSPPPGPRTPEAKKAQKPKARPVKKEAAPSEEAGFVYNPQGLRDPFKPFIRLRPEKKAAKKAPEKFVPKTPLQRYALEELKLVGVVWRDGKGSWALVEDPEGKGYIVRVGTLIGDRGGRIVSIRPDRVEVEERVIDILGEERINRVTMRLHTPEGEVRP